VAVSAAKAPSKSRVFTYGRGPHSFGSHVQLAIQAHDMTVEECRLMRAIVSSNSTNSPSYQLGRACGVFLQGYEEPYPSDPRGGWVLVEFWCDPVEREDAVRAFVDHVNAEFARMEAARAKETARSKKRRRS